MNRIRFSSKAERLIVFANRGPMGNTASVFVWFGPVATLFGVALGGFLTFKVQARLQDRATAQRIQVTLGRLTAVLKTAESRFELSGRIGGRPIEGDVPFERLMTLGFSHDVAELAQQRSASGFYEAFAELEQAYRSMWYSSEQIKAAEERLNLGSMSNPDVARQHQRIAEGREALISAARRAQELCRDLRRMVGDESETELVKLGVPPAV